MEKRDWIKIIGDSQYTYEVPIRRGSERKPRKKIGVKTNAWDILNDIKKEAGSITGFEKRLDFYIDEYDNFINQFSNELALNKYSDITGVEKSFTLLIDSLKERLQIQNKEQNAKANVDTNNDEIIKEQEINEHRKSAQKIINQNSDKWEYGELEQVVERLINSKNFKELNIEKKTTLKANHREKIKSMAKEISGELYPERELNTKSLFTKLAQKGYHKEKRR